MYPMSYVNISMYIVFTNYVMMRHPYIGKRQVAQQNTTTKLAYINRDTLE